MDDSGPSLSLESRTLSLQLVADPIAKQVAELEKKVHSRRGGAVPDVLSASAAIREAACRLHQIAKKELSRIKDKQLEVALPTACDETVKATEELVEAARHLRQHSTSQQHKNLFLGAARKIHAGLLQVLCYWDDHEIHMICTYAQVSGDRLQLMNGCRSMRSLLLSFKSFAESMKELLSLVDKRLKELVDKEKKKRLFQILEKLKHALPKFSGAMQSYVRAPQSLTSKDSKDEICMGIAEGLADLIVVIKGETEAEGLARNIVQVKQKLNTSKRYSIGPELDRHIDAIMENSKAVAHVSHNEYREMILRECGEVLTLRKELGTHYEAVQADPGSARAKRAFDKCTKKLCEKLNELDRWVADSVVDQVTDVFVQTSQPINHLVQAATASRPRRDVRSPPPTVSPTPPTFAPSTGSEEVDTAAPSRSHGRQDTKHMAELFRKHSRRLSQVAVHAAQSSTDTERTQLIQALAKEVDELTTVVVERAEQVSRNPGNRRAREELDTLRRQWASKVQELTQVIDDIIDPEDFMAKSEANIQQDMEKCQAAIRSRKWEELRRLVLSIAAKSRRALEVGEAAVSKASDHAYKTTLSSAVDRLEKAIPKIVSTANKVIEDPSSRERHNRFLNSLLELLSALQSIHSVLGTEIDITSGDDDTPPTTPRGSARVHSPKRGGVSAHERMTRRNVKRAQSKPQYIGTLGTDSGRSSRNRNQSFGESMNFTDNLDQSYDSGTQTTPTSSTREQASQVDTRYLSTNATHGSAAFSPRDLTPNSSTSSWRSPAPLDMSPVRHAPLSPDSAMPTSPPHYTPPSPPTPSSPTLSPLRRAPHRPRPSSPTVLAMSTYVSPLHKVVSAANKGDQPQLSSHASDLTARTIRLTEMADSAASTLNRDADLVKVIKTKSSQVNKLTPRILDKADLVSRNPHHQDQREEFQDITHQWAGHVRDLIDATQQANLPWSHRAEQLVKAAETRDNLESQMEHVSTQTRKMVDVATMAIEAAQKEEAIGGTEDIPMDMELQDQVQHVRTKMSEIEKLVPQLLGAVEMAAGQPVDSTYSEHLHLLAQEWATKAKVLMKGVDDITLGMGGAADTLFLSAKSGDAELQAEQTKAIKSLASSLQNIAMEAMEGCDNEEKVKVVRVVARNIEKLSTQLVECADTVAEAVTEDNGEPHQLVQEDTEILRRDWSSQVHLLTAHVDELTTETSAPLDRLVDLSLQASRTSGHAKQTLLNKFDRMAMGLSEQLNQVDRLYADNTKTLTHHEQRVEEVRDAIQFLKKLTPHVVGAAKSLEGEPGSAMLEHFNHLRRQWAAKAQFLLANLRRITAANVDDVIDAFEDLLHDSYHHVTSPKTDQSDGLNYSSASSSQSLHRSYSSEVVGDTTPRTRFDFDDTDIRTPSTPTIEISPKKRQHIPSLSEMGLRHVTPRVKRPTSMAVPLPSWALGGGEDTDSADSIALAAHLLRELTDEFLDEKNPLIDVGKTMSEQMSQMAEFTRGKGELENKMDMIHTAKAVAANAQTIHRLANLISKQCVDERSKNNLLCCAEMIPTLSTQLTILASVKTSTPEDVSADVMLVKNAQNLMQAVIKTVRAAEAACMKDLKPMEGQDQETINLATSWKRKLYTQRARETVIAPRGARGLRKLNKFRISTPSAVDVIKPSEANMKSPTKH